MTHFEHLHCRDPLTRAADCKGAFTTGYRWYAMRYDIRAAPGVNTPRHRSPQRAEKDPLRNVLRGFAGAIEAQRRNK